MEPQSEESSIERLKRTLYSRNEYVVPKEKRTPVPEHDLDVPKSWGDRPFFGFSSLDMTKNGSSFFNKFFVISVVFFVISLIIASYIFFGGFNMISSNNVDIKVIAPSSISSGEELSIGLSIDNLNSADIEDVILHTEYPNGAASIDDSQKIISRETTSIGTIGKGQSKDYSVRTLLFGEKDVIKGFTFRLEYKVKGSNATFSKEKKYEVLIGSSPILLNVVYPQEVNSGQELVLNVDITSNSSVVMKDSMIKVEYPYGFTYKDSSLKPLRNNSVWNIGDLKNGDNKKLTIRGTLVGQNSEDRSFRFSAGTQSRDDSKDFDTLLAVSTVTIGIRKSFFDLTVSSGQNNVIQVGQLAPVTISWQNTVPDRILDSQIEATISGNVFDRTNVKLSGNGFYRSVDNTIIWDKNNLSNLASMSPGDSGMVVFSVGAFTNPVQLRSIKNPHIDVHVAMMGDRSGTEAMTMTSSADLVIKMDSTLAVTMKSYRAYGQLTNSGPIPPRADKESTYTITWTLTNTTNDLKDTAVSAVLPLGVTWKGETSPASERVNFTSDNRMVTWNVGNVNSGTGFTYSPREVSFKVGLIPSLSQIGNDVFLASGATVTSTDTYTNSSIRLELESVTTKYSDPEFKQGDDRILQ
ncbi:MAG: hypothetical protein WAX85_02775 [Minisyncoccia bacterium]